MELPPLSARQQASDADAEVTRLRREVEDAHKARAPVRPRRQTVTHVECASLVKQVLAQLSAEKLRITAACVELVCC